MNPLHICHRCEFRQKDCAGRCLCLKDNRDIIEHAREGKCPISRFELSAEELAKLFPPPALLANEGPALWAMLHRWALMEKPDRGWLGAFASMLLCGDCAQHWHQWIAANPPPADDAELFAWTVLAHNAVNAHLGKPVMSLDAARQRWSKDGM